MSCIASCADRTHLSQDLVGGNALNLARIASTGMQAPLWFCVTTTAFEQLRCAGGSKIEALLVRACTPAGEDPAEISRLLTQEFAGISLMCTHADEIFAAFDRHFGPQTLVAVRSSAVCEDSQSASYAGQFSTYLNVRRHQLLEKVVAYMLLRFGGLPLEIKVVHKTAQVVPSGTNGTDTVAVSASDANAPVLNRDQLAMLHQRSLALEDHFAAPHDLFRLNDAYGRVGSGYEGSENHLVCRSSQTTLELSRSGSAGCARDFDAATVRVVRTADALMLSMERSRPHDVVCVLQGGTASKGKGEFALGPGECQRVCDVRELTQSWLTPSTLAIVSLDASAPGGWE